jgi:predicted DNA-binding transcriptional regulator AlpA
MPPKHVPVRRIRSSADDQLLSIPQVIAELGISRATFYRWRSLRKGPASLRLPNGSIRIRRSDLDVFLTACEEPHH